MEAGCDPFDNVSPTRAILSKADSQLRVARVVLDNGTLLVGIRFPVHDVVLEDLIADTKDIVR